MSRAQPICLHVRAEARKPHTTSNHQLATTIALLWGLVACRDPNRVKPSSSEAPEAPLGDSTLTPSDYAVICNPPTGPAAPLPTVTPAMQQCQVDADCAIVQVGCCDPCNGGSALRVNKAHAAALTYEAGQHYVWHCAPKCQYKNGNITLSFPPCTELYCPHLVPACINGICDSAQ